VETYSTQQSTTIKTTTETTVPAKETIKEQDLHDAPDAVITAGTKCKRKACEKQYKDESSKSEDCVFHPGLPIFHEGSKGWSCCSRKVLEFDEFLKIKGCLNGKHRFTEIGDEFVECRRDCKHDIRFLFMLLGYQTQTHVILSIFAKKVNKEKTIVSISENQLKVSIEFLDGKKSIYETLLFQPVDPSASKFEILSTKIEIELKKANGLSWASIEPNSSITSWTTFGTSGMVGTVGGKEAIIAGDAPISLLL
jgi:hypothetical protein